MMLWLLLQVDFDRDVRPILDAHCVKCHGAEKPKGRFRLDARLPAFKSGHLKPHDKDSRFLQVLVAEEDERMPAKAPPLKAEQIDLLRRWVAEGAKWPDDGKGEDLIWSLRPIRRPASAPGASARPVSIDSLIAARLGGLKLAGPADPRTVIRRLSYTLTGLPPTPDEAEAFVARPDVAAAVDRLLASPRYGERWARLWLDAAHYADSHGHDQDRPRPNAWPYRDYLVSAFNDDVPYARFVQEQIAGDVLFPESSRGLVATGFLAAGPWDESSQMHIMGDTVDKKIAQNLDRDDMLAATMVTFMSTTVACARCHDHKFDPVSQVEYYQLQACFAGVDRSDRPFDDDPAVNKKRQELLRRRTRLDLGFVDEEVEDVEAIQAVAWTIVPPKEFKAESSTLTPQPDGSLLAGGERPEMDTYTLTLDVDKVTAIRLEVLTDENLSNRGPGRQDNGNLHLSEIRILDRNGPVKIAHASSDFDQQGWTIAHAIDGKIETAWGVYPEIGRAHEAWFELATPAAGPLTVVLEQKHGRKHLIARPRLSVTAAAAPVRRKPLPPEALIPKEKRTPEQRKALAAHVLRERIARELAALPKPRQVYAAASDFPRQSQFSPAKKPRPIRLLHRGDVTQPRQPIAPGGLAAIPVPFPAHDVEDEGARRAALARWIADPGNVLTWRSIVNRVWHHHFGRGIVDTPGDFGRMGGEPSHPELLDFLASRLLETGSLKALHRLILTSDAYLRASTHDPEAAKVDVLNTRLWRGNRLRLDADQLRDSILAVSGRLDLTMGGPPVMQFHYHDFDPGRTPVVDFAKFDVEKPEGRRRSVYRWVFRTLPDPFLDVFDAADASQLTGARNVSVTPLQAMALRNNPFVIKQSEHFARRVGSDVELAFRLAFQRRPTPDEAAAFTDYAGKHGMSSACRVLLNSNEFLFVD